METSEHKQVGDQIRIDNPEGQIEGEPLNPYLKGSLELGSAEKNNLTIKMMETKNGIPIPLELDLTAGDVVAMAGDYYTYAGWGDDLTIPQSTGDVVKDNETLFNSPVSKKEAIAFRRAYDDLASPNVKETDIKKIYAIENRTYIPFFKSLNDIFQQLVYSLTVKGYSDKLNRNVAHFAPWSARAYIVGHNSAMRKAELAYYFNQLAEGIARKEIPQEILQKLEKIEANIKDSPGTYHLEGKKGKELYTELANRYHALAVARDLYALHFYSDHFAGGHLSRIGQLRETMPERFGIWGGVLINNMHNEDNTNSVTADNPYQITGSEKYIKTHQDSQAYGDGTYLNRGNDDTANLLINGMDNSLGDVSRLMKTGYRRKGSDYGGLAFLPEVDYSKEQPQPLLINGPKGKVYYRADVKHIKMLTPDEYQKTLANPGDPKYGYKELKSPLDAFILVFKLRALGFIYKPEPVTFNVKPGVLFNEQEKSDNTSDLKLAQKPDETSGLTTQPTLIEEFTPVLPRNKDGTKLSDSLNLIHFSPPPGNDPTGNEHERPNLTNNT